MANYFADKCFKEKENSQLLKCEYFLVGLLIFDSRLSLFGLWTKQDIWGCHLGLQSTVTFFLAVFWHLMIRSTLIVAANCSGTFCVCNFMSIFSSILRHFLSRVVGIPLDSMQLNLSNTAVQYTGPVYHVCCLLGQECSLVHYVVHDRTKKYRHKGKGKIQLLEMQNTAKQHVLNLDKSVCASPK